MAGFITGVTTAYYVLTKILLKLDPGLRATQGAAIDFVVGGVERVLDGDSPRFRSGSRRHTDYSGLSRQPRPDVRDDTPAQG